MSNIKAPKHLPRTGDDDLDELKESIKEHGQLQPIIVDAATGRVIVGERRRRATAALRLEPEVIEIDVADEAEELAIRLSEEMTKLDIPLLERAEAAKKLADLARPVTGNGHGGSNAKNAKNAATVSEQLDVSQDVAEDLLKIAGLPDEVKKIARDGDIGTGALRVIGRAAITDKQKTVIARKIANGKITSASARGIEAVLRYAREAESLVRKQILDDPTKSFEDAQRTAQRIKDKAKKDKAKTEDPGLPMTWFVHKMVGKLNTYATDLASLHGVAQQVPDPQRSQLTRALSGLQKQIDRWLMTLEDEPVLPPNGAKMRKVLEKVGGEWQEIEVG